MSEQHNQTSTQETPEPYTPASPVKRTMAWIGVVYMVIIVALTTYYYFTGTALGNLSQLLVLPGLIGAGIVLVVAHQTEGTPSKAVAYGAAFLLWGLAIATLPLAWIGLMSNFS